jgi:hypothetical protein
MNLDRRQRIKQSSYWATGEGVGLDVWVVGVPIDFIVSPSQKGEGRKEIDSNKKKTKNRKADNYGWN